MERKLEDLAREAMELAPDARAALAKRLLDSLESPEPVLEGCYSIACGCRG